MKLEGPTMFAGGLQRALNRALRFAAKRGAEVCTLEDLLLRLMKDQRTLRAVRAFGGTPERLRGKLKAHLREKRRPPVASAVPGPELIRVLERSVCLARALGRVPGMPEVLGVIQAEPESYAAHVLHEEGLNPIDLLVQIMVRRQAVVTETLERSRLGQCPDRLVGRQSEVDLIMSTLAASAVNSAFLVGEPGVGKTAVLARVGRLLTAGGASVKVLDAVRMVKRAYSRGEFERRMNALVRELRADRDAVLLIDNLSVLLVAEASWGVGGTSGLVGWLLWEPSFRCVAAVQPPELEAYLERNPFVRRRFQVVAVGELGPRETVLALGVAQAELAASHGVVYTAAARLKAFELSRTAISGRKQPGAALDVLDRAAATVKAAGRNIKGQVRIDARAVEVALAGATARRARLDQRERRRLSRLEEELKGRIVGQDTACAAVAQAVRLRRAGLGNPDRPVGCFLFVGPTGVGKTELARQLAAVIDAPLVRFDMSECSERHSVSRLIGAPPGYVGYDRGGLLTEAVHKAPASVLLLDEIEKAHPDIYNLLLQVMDRGCLTESTGRVVDFRQAVLIMTSNVGSRESASQQPGFVRKAAVSVDRESLRATFSPEFRDRLDAIIDFGRLQPPQMRLILERRIAELTRAVRARGVELNITEGARAHLLEKGFDSTQGARPLVGVLQAKITRPIADQLLFGDLVKGGVADADCVDGALVLTFRPALKKARRANRPASHETTSSGVSGGQLAEEAEENSGSREPPC
jgi:ATP-dependent Clp protease ATP-binding subunit ClpA